MKSLYLLLSLGSLAMARNCEWGLIYCGGTLLEIGDYQGYIEEAFYRQHVIYTPEEARDTIFSCDNGAGDITRISYCGPRLCKNAGAGNSDYCEGDNFNLQKAIQPEHKGRFNMGTKHNGENRGHETNVVHVDIDIEVE